MNPEVSTASTEATATSIPNIVNGINLSRRGFLGWFPGVVALGVLRALGDVGHMTLFGGLDLCFTIVVGFMVGTRLRGAIVLARWFFIYRMVLAPLVLFGALAEPSEQQERLLVGVVMWVVWTIYFARSERVRLTFGRRIFDRKVAR